MTIRLLTFAPRATLLAAALGLLTQPAHAADFPLDQLPPHISLVLPSGERPDWEPEGSDRFIYVTEPGGTPREHSLVSGTDEEITAPGLDGGCWRAYYLSDGNYLMTIGPDRGLAVPHVVDRSGSVAPVNLREIAHEGVAVSRHGLRIAWTTGPNIHVGEIAYDAGGVPSLVNRETILDSATLPTGDGTSYNGDIEPQNFRLPLENELIFSRYGTSSTGKYSAETWGYSFETGEVVNYSNRPAWYDEPEGIFPDGEYTLVECDMFLPVSDHARVLDLYRMRLDGTGTDMLRLTHFGDVTHSSGVNFKANQGVVSSDGRYMLFGEGRSNTDDAPGSGFGIYLFDFEMAGIDVGLPPSAGGAGGESGFGGGGAGGAEPVPVGAAGEPAVPSAGGSPAGTGALGGGAGDASAEADAAGGAGDDGGCGCRTVPSPIGGAWPGWLALLGALLLRRRRSSPSVARECGRGRCRGAAAQRLAERARQI